MSKISPLEEERWRICSAIPDAGHTWSWPRGLGAGGLIAPRGATAGRERIAPGGLIARRGAAAEREQGRAVWILMCATKRVGSFTCTRSLNPNARSEAQIFARLPAGSRSASSRGAAGGCSPPYGPLDSSTPRLLQALRAISTVLTGTGARDEMSPQELSAFMKKAGPIFEGEEERIEALILEGREKTLLREPPVL